MAKERSFACCCLAALLFVASTIAAGAAWPTHHGHIHRRGHNGLQSQQDALPNVSNSALNHGSGNSAAKPENQGPPTNGHGAGTANGGSGPNQDSTGREGKQNRVSERSQSNSEQTTNGSPGKGANTPDIPMNELGAVDTRITVQPRLHDPIRHDAGERKDKTKPHMLTALHPRPQFVPAREGEAIHNAIGVSMAPSRGTPEGGQDSDSHPGAVSPAVAPPVRDGGTGTSMTGVNAGRVTISQPNHRALSPASGESATINRGGFYRRGSDPVMLGGPIKTAAGINGSTIKPKH